MLVIYISKKFLESFVSCLELLAADLNSSFYDINYNPLLQILLQIYLLFAQGLLVFSLLDKNVNFVVSLDIVDCWCFRRFSVDICHYYLIT